MNNNMEEGEMGAKDDGNTQQSKGPGLPPEIAIAIENLDRIADAGCW